MSDLDRVDPAAGAFTPSPGAASLVRQVLAQAAIESKLMLRNGEQVLLAVVIPIIVLVGGVEAAQHIDLVLSQRPIDEFVPGVLALAVMSTAFTSLAIATGFERRYGVLERLAATPLGKAGLLAGKALSVAVIALAQILVLALVAAALGWRPQWTVPSLGVSVVTAVLAAGCFGGLALLIAGRLRAEVTLAVANIVYVVGLAAGALVIPVAHYPAAVQPLLELLPTAALGESLRAGAVGTVLLWPLPVLLVWTAVAGLGAWRGFRWTS